MGLFRIILGAGDRDDDGGPPAGVSRGTVHGSHHKAALNRLGGRAMGRDSKPSGFFHKDPGRPDRGGRP